MAQGENAEHNYSRELWGARPFSNWSKSPEAKTACRRKERRVLKGRAIREEVEMIEFDERFAFLAPPEDSEAPEDAKVLVFTDTPQTTKAPTDPEGPVGAL